MERLGPTEKPAPYQVADRTDWIVSEEDASLGFAILVRTSITNAEQQFLIDQHAGIAGEYSEQWNAIPAEERDVANSPRAKELALLAPYVLDWNATGFLRDGTRGPIPPPAVAGPAAWECVDEPEKHFATRVVLNGYLFLGKALDLRKRSSPSGDTSAAPTSPEIPKPKRRGSQRTSSTPGASTSPDSGPGNMSP